MKESEEEVGGGEMAQWLVAHLPLAPLSHLAGQTALVAMSGYPPTYPLPGSAGHVSPEQRPVSFGFFSL